MPRPKKSKKELSVFSFSKLEAYNKCSYMFKLQYIDKVPGVDTASVETEIGSRCHNALEQFYLDPNIPDAYTALLDQWKAELKQDGLDSLYTELNHIASDISKLSIRASASYSKPDAIRTSTGAVPRSPEMTSEWKKAVKELRLDDRQHKIDRLAAQVQKKWTTMSLSEVFAHSCSIMFGYKNPTDIAEPLWIELAISDVRYAAADPNDPTKQLLDSKGKPVTTTRTRGANKAWTDPATGKLHVVDIHNKVTFPGLTEDASDFIRSTTTSDIEYPDDGVLFNGYIDLVCRTPDGKIAIIDHKTSKGEVPSVSKVARHQQLLLYGWAVWRRTGKQPDYIGINHLRTNKLVLAPFSLDLALEVLKTKLQTIRGVNHKVFIKQDPYGYGSMCITDSAKGPRYCPFFSMCHPDLVEPSLEY